MNFNVVNTFIGADFLLQTKAAQRLYHETAARLPVIDYHNHLSPKLIFENRPFENLYEAWLKEDHYKWRAMRANGVSERYITGDVAPRKKFDQWAKTAPYTIGNPLFHWTHLELLRYFGITKLLQPSTAEYIYHSAGEMLQQTTARQLLKKMNVKLLCTTDDPLDSLEYHQQLKEETCTIKVLPTFRADRVFDIQTPAFIPYITALGERSGENIQSIMSLLESLQKHIDYFHENGCRISDYGLERIYADDVTQKEADVLFKKRLSGNEISPSGAGRYKSFLQYHLSKMYCAKGWVQQFHLGAVRNNNKRLLTILGNDAGCDSIGDLPQVRYMSEFFGRLDAENSLARTIIYNINPSHNESFAAMAGNFNDGITAGKMQWGAPWWFQDQKDGMERHITVLSNTGLLSRFIGMLTDSRSILSFPRHEYFRRILCNFLGNAIERGELPDDLTFFKKIVADICYDNSLKYFGFDA